MPAGGMHIRHLFGTSKHSQEKLQDREMEQCCLTEAMQRQRFDQLSEDIIALCGLMRGSQYKYKLNFAEQCHNPDPWDPASTAPFDVRIGLQLERHQKECYEKMCCEPQILYSVSDHITCQRRTAFPLSTNQRIDLAEELQKKLEKRAKKDKIPLPYRSKFGNSVTNQGQRHEESDVQFLPSSQPVHWWKLGSSRQQTPSSTYTSNNTSGVLTS